MENSPLTISNTTILVEAALFMAESLKHEKPQSEALAKKLASHEQTFSLSELKNVYMSLIIYRNFLDDVLDDVLDGVVDDLRDETLQKKKAVNTAMRELRQLHPEVAESVKLDLQDP